MRIKQDKPCEALALLGPQLVPVGLLCELEKAATSLQTLPWGFIAW